MTSHFITSMVDHYLDRLSKATSSLEREIIYGRLAHYSRLLPTVSINEEAPLREQ